MSRICEICQKGYLRGNLVPRGIGRRVTKRTLSARQPNLRSKRMEINGTSVRVTMCASCLKRMEFEQKKLAAVAKTATVSASA